MLTYQDGVPFGTAEEIREEFFKKENKKSWNNNLAKTLIERVRTFYCDGQYFDGKPNTTTVTTNLIILNKGMKPSKFVIPNFSQEEFASLPLKLKKGTSQVSKIFSCFKPDFAGFKQEKNDGFSTREKWVDYLLYCRIWETSNCKTPQQRINFFNNCLIELGYTVLYPLTIQDFCVLITIVYELSYERYLDLEAAITHLLSEHPDFNKWKDATSLATTPIFMGEFVERFVLAADSKSAYDDIKTLAEEYANDFAEDFGRFHVTAFWVLASFFLTRDPFAFLETPNGKIAPSKIVALLQQKTIVQKAIDAESFGAIIYQKELELRRGTYNYVTQKEKSVEEILEDGIDIFGIYEFKEDVTDYLQAVQLQDKKSIAVFLETKKDPRRLDWNVDCKKYIFCPSIESGNGAKKQYEHLENTKIAESKKRTGVFSFLTDEFIDGKQVFFKKDISRNTLLLAIIYTTAQYQINSFSARQKLQENIDIMLEHLGMIRLNSQNNKIDFLLLSALHNCQCSSVKRPLLNYIVNELKLNEKELIDEEELS